MVALVMSLAVAITAPVPPDKKVDEEFQKKVAASRAKAVKYLKDQQQQDGSWERPVLKSLVGLDGGTTALAVLGLFEAGLPANDPAVAKAIEYLLALKPDKTYVVSLQTQVLARADAKKYAKEIQANADWLIEKAILKNQKLVGWSYPGNDMADNSNTHFAVTGLHAAAQAGAKVDAEIWQKIRALYADTQRKDGAWGYHNAGDQGPSHSMTVAVLVSLAVAVKYDKNAKGQDAAFDKGMAYRFTGKVGEWGEEGKSYFVWWMTTAELGRALGAEEFKSGKVNIPWYRQGCEKILKAQQADGSFTYTDDAPGIDKSYPVISTACGLYLLGAPVNRAV